jgi:phospholipase C
MKRSPRHSRTSVNLSESVHQQLNMYALAAVVARCTSSPRRYKRIPRRIAMKVYARTLAGILMLLSAMVVQAQISSFQHIVIIFQENRTPDNLFQGLCGAGRSLCPNPYDLQNFGINSKGRKITLTPVTLRTNYDLGHSHWAFVEMCDLDTTSNQCKMDGADKISCRPKHHCPPHPQFQFVRSSDVAPYLTMAQQYGWANFMFQTNQGPSTPAHQFIFAGTSAPSAADDQAALFVAEQYNGLGCLAPRNWVYKLISPQTAPEELTLLNNPLGTVCFSHPTMASLLDSNTLTWKYYTPGGGSTWTAPNWIRDICFPNINYTQCTGQEWNNNVDLKPKHVLTDIGACKLANVSWVIPTGQNSDHPNGNRIGGPSWVASIVNAIGNSTTCDNNTGYWKNTAIFITWDDWGGWFDHEPPTLLSVPNQGQGDYQYGFRVPLVVVSAYTPLGYVNNNRHDFGSILRFIEHNFGIKEGALNFADARATSDLTGFFNLKQMPRTFKMISAPKDAKFFLNDNSPMEPPDND